MLPRGESPSGIEQAEIQPVTSSTALRCPVCYAGSRPHLRVPDWGEMRACTACGLVFANPLRLKMSPETLYSGAYEAAVADSGLTDFHSRLRHRSHRSLHAPDRAFGSPLFSLALERLRITLGQGATVLDLGCGLGYFLYALRRDGFHAVGIEPAEAPARTLQQEGFRVWQGTVDSYPASWPTPDAVTSFYVLHHSPDPAGFLRAIARRFPDAPLLLAESEITGPDLYRTPGFKPPRTFTWW